MKKIKITRKGKVREMDEQAFDKSNLKNMGWEKMQSTAKPISTENKGGQNDKKTAKELVAEIEAIDELGKLEAYREYTQKTVVGALAKREKELAAGADEENEDSDENQDSDENEGGEE